MSPVYNNLCVLFAWQYVLKPTFTKQQIANLDKQAKLSRAYDGTTYLPGIVGLNNIKANDYANAVLQVCSRKNTGEGRVTGSRQEVNTFLESTVGRSQTRGL